MGNWAPVEVGLVEKDSTSPSTQIVAAMES